MHDGCGRDPAWQFPGMYPVPGHSLRLTHWFAGPLSLAVTQTDALQHVAARLVWSSPGVADLVGGPALVTAV